MPISRNCVMIRSATVSNPVIGVICSTSKPFGKPASGISCFALAGSSSGGGPLMPPGQSSGTQLLMGCAKPAYSASDIAWRFNAKLAAWRTFKLLKSNGQF